MKDIDTIAPSTTIAINPTDPSNSADADFTFTSSEPSSTFECDMDGAGFGACTSPKSYTSLGEGPHTFQVRATDEIDTISPTISLTSPANGSIINDSTPALTYLVSDGTVVVKVDDIVVVKTSGQSLDALSDASHTITIESTDSAGNINTTTNTFTVDTIAPNTTISSQPSDPSITASASLEFSAEIGATFECKLDSGSYAACTSLKAYTGLADGSHTFLVRAIDTATNVDASPASYTWTIDLPPVIGSGSPAEVLSSGTTQIAIGVETNKNAICKYATTSGNAYSAMTIFDGTGSTTHSFTATGLADGGSYGYFVRCQGGNNNVNLTDYLVSFSVAAPAPVVIQAAAASSSSKSSSHNDKKKKVSSHTITNSKKSITRGATLIQRGKKFSKNNYVLLYFTKYGGGYYAPQKIKTSSSGAFITKYVINKPKGTYGWYALDIKTGKKSKTVYYKVK
ncbi:MAG: OmpA domain protein [Candidatus Moranbacteria bacterium GW2011_GWC2_37_8]|nr:MAG: OmpA domain protein [Candidatus Moranbacteria bacterium GW2011_GWC2_37_8]